MVQKSREHQLRLVGYPIIYKVFIHSNGGFSRPDLLDPLSGDKRRRVISADLESLPFSKVVTPPRGVLKQGEKKETEDVWGIFIFRDPRFGDIPPQLDLYNWHNWHVNGGTFQRVESVFQKPPQVCISFLIEAEVLERSGKKKKQLKLPSWWFQPIWKILVNLDHFPKQGWK